MRRSVGFAVPLVSLLLLAACDSGDTSSDSSVVATSDSTTDTSDTLSTTSLPVTSDSTAPSGSVVGSWTADASAILGANTANTGGTGGLVCTGPIVMTFNADGSFDRLGDVSCMIGGVAGIGSMSSVGNWEDTGTTLVISGTTTSGTMTIAGTVAPLPDSFGDGTADYAIVDDTLTISFTIDPVGTVTQIYTRV